MKLQLLDYVKNYALQIGLGNASATILVYVCLVLLVLFSAIVANYIVKKYLVKFLQVTFTKSERTIGKAVVNHKLITKISHLAPAFVVFMSLPLFIIADYPITQQITMGIRMFASIYIIVAVAVILLALLKVVDDVYRTTENAERRPIKSYLQVVGIIIYLFAAILITSTLLNKSPLVFFTGLGAAMALIVIIFKDAILGLVASVQLTSYDMIRLGDWIDMPDYGASGDVIDISLGTIKVQNFDKTITTIPTGAILSSGIKNWRGMTESGGRRIKRSIFIDMDTIKFCDAKLLETLSRVDLLKPYIDEKHSELEGINTQNVINNDELINGRRLTNVGLYRKYINLYLASHPGVHKNFTFLIRQLQSTAHGLPIEIYVFTNDTNWNRYEAIQADIFDHLLSAIKRFDLRVFQNTSGTSFDVVVHRNNSEQILEM